MGHWLIDALWQHVTSWNLVLWGNNPLPATVLIHPSAIQQGRFPANIHWNEFENYMVKFTAAYPRGQWVDFWSHLMKQTTFILAVSQVSIFADEIIHN